MQTAKTLQLKDSSNVNISPATNIESLYYEVTDSSGVIYRHNVYPHFPIYVNYGQTDASNYMPYINQYEEFKDLSDPKSTIVESNPGEPVQDIIVSRLN